MFRRQALAWLRADLAVYAKLAEREEPAVKLLVRRRLGTGRRTPTSPPCATRRQLDQLPDDERKEWRQLWDDVAALLKTVEAKK